MARRQARLAGQFRKHLSGIVAAVVTVALVLYGVDERWEYLWFDQLFEIRGVRPPTSPIAIVTIDESSFQELGRQWPFPRALHAELIDRIAAGGPLVIGFDVIFVSESMFGPDDDAALATALARAGNVVLASAGAQDAQPLVKIEGKGAGAARELSNLPLPILRDVAAGIGPVNVDPDPDSHIRRVPLRVRVPDPWKGYESWFAFDALLHRRLSAAGFPTRPLPDGAKALINFRGPPRTFQWVPYYRVVTGEIAAELFRDKIVLIGSTSEVQHDIFATAYARNGTMPGVEMHANALDTLIRGDAIREVPRLASTGLTLVAALIGSGLVVRLRAARALAVALLIWATGAVLAVAAFAFADVWMRGVAVTFGLGLGYVATVVENFVREQREKQRLSRFFSPDVLRAVVRSHDEQSLGPRRRTVTVLFSDVRGFTSIAERLQPEQVQEMLDEYLTEMTQVVFKHRGSIDKYIGDGIMALYNAPFEDGEHALNAVRTGLEFQERARAVSARWEAKAGVPIRIGVGINTGEVIVGSLGSRQRLEYTAIGDNVNLAARLESVTKDYGAPIVISEYTYEYVKGRIPTAELGDVTVKGKSQPVKIYGVVPASVRRHPRAALVATAQLAVIGDARTCRARTVDISEGGVALAGVPPDWDVGSKLRIRIEGGGLSRPIVAEGTIVSRRAEAAGVQFASMEEDSAPAVARYVARERSASPDDQD